MVVLFRPTILLALALIAVIVMMVLPMPPFILDIGLATSFALAILIFTVTLFIERPLDFSSFPTILLASLMLRLSLNISSTKLIIGNGHTGPDAAGGVIAGFASFVMGDNILLGIVVFVVIMIVNFMVITKGAARMAEVGARFALDAMPGKQMAIDADLNAGAITHAEARARRETEQRETTFFGSLDGASKFVKGDAVAGLLITLLNIVVGLTAGIMMHGMPIGEAFETYTILTVGDGLVTQIPAVIISIAAALLLARGGNTGATDIAVFRQLGSHPAALGTVGVLMFLFGLVPGLPFVPFALGGAILSIIAWRRRDGTAIVATEANDTPPERPAEKSIGDLLDLDDLHVEFAPDLVAMVLDPGTGLDVRIGNMRRHVAAVYGLVLPEIRLTDDPSLPSGTYVIRIQGVERARAVLRTEKSLALLPVSAHGMPAGEDVREPVYNAPARWIAFAEQETAALAGATIVTPPEVLATHLLEVIRRNLGRLLSLKTLRRLLDELCRLTDPARAEANRRFLDEMIPDRVPMDLFHAVLRNLLEEQVSIRNIPLILEAIAEARPMHAGIEGVVEHVRQRLGFQLVAPLKREDGTIPLVQLDPEWEEKFAAYQIDAGSGLDVALPPDLFNRLAGGLADKLRECGDRGLFPALITSARRRRFLRTVMSARGLTNPVVSFEEVGLEARPALVGTVAA